MLLLTSQVSFCEKTTPKSLLLTVYPDGFVLIDYTLQVDETFPTQNITVFGQVLEDLLVIDSDGLPLGYAQNDTVLSVYSLGTSEIEITYLTQDLTSKEGRYWTLTVTSPTTTYMALPSEAAIISLNKVPEMIETQNQQVTLLMGNGSIQVTYVIGVIGTEEHSQIVLTEAQTTITEIKKQNIIITEAETKLQQATEAFGLGNYAEAETLSAQAKDLAIQTNQTATQAQSKITEAQTQITNAETQQRTNGLNTAKNLLDQANTAYSQGNYSEALNYASQATIEAEQSTLSMTEPESFPFFEAFAGALLVAAAVLGFVFVRSRKNAQPETKQKRQIDSERIFREHKDLMPEEKQAIQFLVGNNGEAFEAELYDHVKLPRTTTWRLVKRLKRMEIIAVTKFRRQNLVRIKNKYDIKE